VRGGAVAGLLVFALELAGTGAGAQPGPTVPPPVARAPAPALHAAGAAPAADARAAVAPRSRRRAPRSPVRRAGSRAGVVRTAGPGTRLGPARARHGVAFLAARPAAPRRAVAARGGPVTHRPRVAKVVEPQRRAAGPSRGRSNAPSPPVLPRV